MDDRIVQTGALESRFAQGLRRDEPLSRYTTFRIGGPAKYFLEVQSPGELIEAVEIARAGGVPCVVIGEGSNLLVSDDGFPGLIVRMTIAHLCVSEDRMTAGAGSKLRALSRAAEAHGLTGLEWAAGVPGTLGGAIRGNAGCFGHEIKDCLARVSYFDGEGANELGADECAFGYRESMFKRNPGWIVLEAELRLERGDRDGIAEKTSAYLALRNRRLPLERPSAGSVFKKYEIGPGEVLSSELVGILRDEHPEFLREGYIPAGWLVENVGLKGTVMGGAQISEKHGNFIVNLGGATAHQVSMLISMIKGKVHRRFGIRLQEEIGYLGF